jgi:hypothetical protein
MAPVGIEDRPSSDPPNQAYARADAFVWEKSEAKTQCIAGPGSDLLKRPPTPRRTPRGSLIVVLPENHVVSPDHLAEGLRRHGDQQVDVVVACAGQPTNLAALQRSIGDAQFLLAPAGTTTADLRELAMRQVLGDIVTLLTGSPIPEAGADTELFMTS